MLAAFREIVLADFEFEAPAGERQVPVCMVVHEVRSGRRFRIWQDQFGPAPPFATGPDVLFVAYTNSAEFGCYRALGWPMPERTIDLFVEFRNRTNGVPPRAGNGLLGALDYFGLDGIGAEEKDEIRKAIGTGAWRGRYTPEAILNYCETDVDALARLLPVMAPQIDVPRSLLRGRYMAAVSAIEWAGIPIDVATLDRLREHWDPIKDRLIADIDRDYGVFDGRTFKADRFAVWLAKNNIPWPRLESGHLDLKDKTFRNMSKGYLAVAPLRELRAALSTLRLFDLPVGRDGRNRTGLRTFRSRTGRNQPGNTEYIFGPAVWLRGLIKPPPGYGVAYIDWSQQEFGIAAALSGDAAMQAAYQSGDCYLAFAKQAGLVPADATKATHASQREMCKACVLGVQYGMGAGSLALRIGQPEIVARSLLRSHRETFPKFWRWSDAVVDQIMAHGNINTVFGWRLKLGEDANPRSFRNFPMQANGAEMLRIACCLATERGVEVCAPVHDALMICAPLAQLDDHVARARAAMGEASRAVLGGFEIGTDVKPVVYPDRYMDPRGQVMWDRVTKLIAEEIPLCA